MFVVFLVIWIYLLYRSPFAQEQGRLFWLGLSYKFMMVLLFGLIYRYHYGAGDAIFYYEQALKISARARIAPAEYLDYLFSASHGWQHQLDLPFQFLPRGAIFLKILSLLLLGSFDSFWFSSMIMGFFAFQGCWYLFQVIVKSKPGWKIPAAISFLFFPSLVFWSAGLLKESLVMGFTGITVGAFLNLVFFKKGNIGSIVLLIAGISGIAIFKYYLAAVLLVALVILAAVEFSRPGPKRLVFPGLFSFAVILLVPLINPNLNYDRFFQVVYENYLLFHESGSHNLLRFGALEPDFTGFILSAPEALVGGLFRPFLWEVDYFLPLLAALESHVLMFLLLLAVVLWIRKPRLELQSGPYIVVIILISLFLAIILALAAPQFGALVRYRIIFWPFLLLVILNQLHDWGIKNLTKTGKRLYPGLITN